MAEDVPTRIQLEAMAAKADAVYKFGKPVSEFDDIELKAFLWWLMSRRIDKRGEELTPVLEELKKRVQAIEADGFIVTITRTTVNEQAVFQYKIDLAPPPLVTPPIT